MELRARIRPLSRRAVWMTALVALLASALAVAAAPDAFAKKRKKAPVITSVAPKDVAVGELLTIKGRNFLRGRSKNTVVFKRDGARAVFAKADIGTLKMLRVKVPGSLQEFFARNAGEPVPTQFRLRVLARKFGKKFTSNNLSPIVSAPRPPKVETPVAALPDGDCDGDGAKNKADGDDDNDGLADGVELSLSLDPCVADTDGDGLLDKWEFDCDRNGVLNRDQADDDSDLLSDGTETAIGTNPCALDTDGDRVEDGYEYRSARDLNDDEYQDPNQYLPYPGKTPYPNPLFKDDGEDYDRDSLTLAEEQALWKYTYEVNHTAQRATDLMDQSQRLSYSDGAQYSAYNLVAGRRKPALAAAGYSMQAQFLTQAQAGGYGMIEVFGVLRDLRDSNLDGMVDSSEVTYYDLPERTTGLPNGWLSDEERDEDADGVTNYDESYGRLVPGYWSACYSMEAPFGIPYAGTKFDDANSDGDTVLDGADDQDHDDIPNLMELSRHAASSGLEDWGDHTCEVKEGIKLGVDLDGDGEDDIKNAHHFDAYGRVNPFNPCLPDRGSRTCDRHPDFSERSAPFDGSPDWYSLQ